jgi:hypothetical protein
MQGIGSLAKHGRNGDTRLAHVAEGEHVIPFGVLEKNPLLKGLLFKEMKAQNIDPHRYIVGHAHNSINPVTGQPEFFLNNIFGNMKGLFKSAAPVIGAIAGSFIPGVGPVIGPALGSFAASKLAGNSTKDALIGAGISGLGGYLASGSTAAQAGGFKMGDGFLGIGGSGPSLGSAVWSGVGSQGIGSLFGRGAPTGVGGAAPLQMTGGGGSNTLNGSAGSDTLTGGAAPNNVTQAAAPTAHADKIQQAMNSPTTQNLMARGLNAEQALKVQGLSLTAPASGAGGILGGIGDFAKNNPMVTAGMIGGGMYLLNQMDKPEAGINGALAPDSQFRNPGGAELLRQNPKQYGFNPRNFMSEGGHVEGPGGPETDDVPAMLSDGEFVFTTKAVEGAGLGDRIKGAKVLYQQMKQLEERAG